MGDNLLPTGYRFYPTEEELLTFYLRNKLDNKREDMEQVIPVADVYSFDPWQLPPISGEPCQRDREQWFFFCPRQEREANGGRRTRTTPSGYWKATGSPSFVYSSTWNKAMGVKKTMVFYQGRAPNGSKTKWKMNEYRALVDETASAPTLENAASKLRSEFSLCRIYTQSGCIRSFDRRPSAVSNAVQPVAGAAVESTLMLMHEEARRVADHGKGGLNKRTRSGWSSDPSDHGEGSRRSTIRQRGEGRGGEGDREDGGVMKMFQENEWDLLDWF